MRNLRVFVGLMFIGIGIIGVFLTWSNYSETRNVDYEYVVKNDHINTIFVKDHVASIEVLPATGSDIVVSWEEDENRKGNHVSIDEHGNQLEIKRQGKSFNIMMPKFNVKQQHMKIHVPKEKLKSLDIQNAVGSVLVRNIQVDELKIQADVQKLVVENVRTKDIHATSSVGSVSIENSTGNITASSNVGSVDVDIAEVTGDMDLSSDVGSVKLTVDEKPENVAFLGSSDLGSVRIFGEKTSIPVMNAAYEVYIKTDVGKVEVRARN